jgi:16S rRNA processing protein RimM
MARRSPSGELPAKPAGGFSASHEDPSVAASPSHLPHGGGAGKITLAAISGAHGIRGEVRLKLFTDDLASLKAHDVVLVGGTARRLLHVGGTAKTPTARIEGIADRSEAERLRGTLIEVDRVALPPLEEGEYYHSDVIGLPCVDQDGTAIGTVSAVENFGAGDLLEVELPTARKSLIPFRPGIAELEEGRIRLDPAFLA